MPTPDADAHAKVAPPTPPTMNVKILNTAAEFARLPREQLDERECLFADAVVLGAPAGTTASVTQPPLPAAALQGSSFSPFIAPSSSPTPALSSAPRPCAAPCAPTKLVAPPPAPAAATQTTPTPVLISPSAPVSAPPEPPGVAWLGIVLMLAAGFAALACAAASPSVLVSVGALRGNGWIGCKAGALPMPAWALDDTARNQASLVRVEAPFGSRLEVFATADDATPTSTNPRVLSFRRVKASPRGSALAAMLSCLPAVLGIGLLRPALDSSPRARERRARAPLHAAATIGACIVLVAVSTCLILVTAKQEDGMEIRARDVTLIRSWAGVRSIAARIAGADVSTVEPFRVTAGLYELELDGSLHSLEKKFLDGLLSKHFKAVAAEALSAQMHAFIKGRVPWDTAGPAAVADALLGYLTA